MTPLEYLEDFYLNMANLHKNRNIDETAWNNFKGFYYYVHALEALKKANEKEK